MTLFYVIYLFILKLPPVWYYLVIYYHVIYKFSYYKHLNYFWSAFWAMILPLMANNVIS